MDLAVLLIVGFVAGMVSGAVMGGPATGYLASIVVGTVGVFLGALANALLGFSAPGDTVALIVLAVLGSITVRLAMHLVSRTVPGLRRA